jgi:polyisoprenoid-binding protein YceI
MVISEVTGYFKEYDIQVNAAKDDFTDATIAATLKVASINTDNERRDGHLKSDDFFSSEKFPDITFKSASVEKTGENIYKIHGNLTIRDVTKSVTFDAVHRGTIKTSRGTVSAWKATLEINRFDYNLKWNRTIETGGLVAGETVTITLNLELQKPTP